MSLSRLAILCLSGSLLVACGGDEPDPANPAAAGKIDISGSQGGGSNAGQAEQARPGQWIDMGDGLHGAVLGWRRADQPGGMMLKDDTRAVAVKLQLHNRGSDPVQLGRKPVKLLAGVNQHGAGLRSAAAAAAFAEDDLPGLPSLNRLLPGQAISGWSTFAPKEADIGELAVLLGRAGNAVQALKPDQIAARVPLADPAEQNPLAVKTRPQSSHALGDTVSGGATDMTVTSFAPVADPRLVADGHRIWRADLRLRNATDQPTQVNSLVMVSSMIYAIDAQGRVHTAQPVATHIELPKKAGADAQATGLEAMLRQSGLSMQLANWPKELAPGAEASGSMAFQVPEDATGLLLVTDTGLGYRLSRDGHKIATAPLGVWPAQ